MTEYMKGKKCEGCKEALDFPHLERVWEGVARQYWHTNCFVYAYPPKLFSPPPCPSMEMLEPGVLVDIKTGKVVWEGQ